MFQILFESFGPVVNNVVHYDSNTKVALNYIQLNYDSIYHTPFYFIQLWFCSHLQKFNKLGRVTSQSKVENKLAPYRTAAKIFTAILDLEARRKAKEASKARRRKIRHQKQQQRMRQFSSTLHRPFLGLFCPIRVSGCAWCLTHIAPPLQSIKRSKVRFPQTTTNFA